MEDNRLSATGLGRRDVDNLHHHTSPCNPLQEHAMVSAQIMEDLAEIKKLCKELETLPSDIASMKEVLELFRSTKGFITTIKVIGIAGISVAAFCAALAGMLTAIKYWANH